MPSAPSLPPAWRSWLLPPEQTAPEANLQVRLLWGGLLFVGGMCTVYSLVVPLLVPTLVSRLWFSVPVLVGCGLLLVAVHRGHTRWTREVFVASCTLSLTMATLTGGGIFAPGQSVFYVTVLIAGLLLSPRIAILLTGAHLLLWGGLLLSGHAQGWMTTVVQHSALSHWFTHVCFLPTLLGIVLIARASFQYAFQDLQRAHAALDAARAENRILIEIINASPDFIGYTDLHGTVKFSNAALMALQDTATASATLPYTPAAAARLRAEGLPHALACGHWRGESALITARGVELPVDQILLVHRDEAGQPTDVSTVMRDIVQQKQVEAALRRSNADLESFAAVASHDIQAPLRRILSYTRILTENHAHQLDAEGQVCAQNAAQNAQQLQELVQNLLAYSRLQSAPGALSPMQIVPTTQILQRVQATLAETLATRRAALHIDNMPDVMGILDQIERLFLNLIDNAVKYTAPEVVPQIRIRGHETAEGAIFSVADNGIGIAPQFHRQIFEPFQRLHTLSPAQGTGIGLAICQRIVENHRGWIQLVSAEGAGSTFSFFIPRCPASVPEPRPLASGTLGDHRGMPVRIGAGGNHHEEKGG